MAALESDSLEDRVRKLLAAAACVAASTGLAAPPSAAGPPSAIVFENARVRVWKVSTKVNRWKHGDVEFEGRGSSHSARNLGPVVEAVLVTLKP